MVNNRIFWFIGISLELTCSFDEHLACSLSERPSDISNTFSRISARSGFGFCLAVVVYFGKRPGLQIVADSLALLVFSA